MIRGGELRREFNRNLRCGGTWALVAKLSLLPPWVRAWTISVSTLWLFFCVCKEVVLVVWVLLLLLTRRAEFKVPLGVSAVFQIGRK